MTTKRTLAVWTVVMAGSLTGYGRQLDEAGVREFIDKHVAQVAPLTGKAGLLYWEATTTGDPAKYKQYNDTQLRIRRIYSDAGDFAYLKTVRRAAVASDPLLKRQVDRLYYAYLQNQIEPGLLRDIVALDGEIQEEYGSFRGTVDGRTVTMSDVYASMTTETDVHRRELMYRASKQVGQAIVGDLIAMVRLRNAAARQVGFDNFHTMTVVTGEQSTEQLDAIFAELRELTNEPFAKMKGELDAVLAKGYGIEPGDLMPWHYHDPFFQRTPLVYECDLDACYADHDVKVLAQEYYAGIGLPVDDILARSDLYDRPGKYPHAYGHDVDRRGDVRILCNLQNTERWAETILHELGHAVYSKYHDRSLPWLLREPAHSFTTEAVAMFFGRLSRNPAWMQRMLGLTGAQRAEIEEVTVRYLRFQQVLFVRWALVMYEFEKAMYADPDQDLNTLWWDLVEKHQYLRRPPGPPDGGWASKLHFVVAPCYYHNYMLGELLASQWHHYIVAEILKLDSDKDVSYVGDRRVGRYLRERVLGPAARYEWNEMIERATGEPLTARYFVEQFIQ